VEGFGMKGGRIWGKMVEGLILISSTIDDSEKTFQ
jgi:hypothetical protein